MIRFLAVGHFLMAFDATFLFALLCLVLGSGMSKGNIASQGGAEVHDRQLVIATARELARCDADGSLEKLFAAPGVDAAAVQEEGWILGVP